jgi:hypothetical protein
MKKERIKYRSKGSCDIKKMKWVQENGSIFTEEIVESRSDQDVFVRSRISIAFNVGELVAKHIVELHNSQLNS